jgi:hypothetical protein
MDGIDHDKALAVLEAEKERRLQAKIDAGELVVRTVSVVVGRDEDAEAATARALANLPTSTSDGRAVHHDLFVVVTGVPRGPNHGNEENSSPQAEASACSAAALASSSEPDHPDEAAPAAGVLLSSRSRPERIFVTTRPATDDGDPGQIAEALWSVDEGCVVLTDLDGRHISGRALLPGQDPLAVARALLREAEEPESFNRPISYPKLGLA